MYAILYIYIVACRVVTMQRPRDKQIYRAASRQRFGKHVPVATDTYVTIKVLLETVFSTRSVHNEYIRV
jgi:hypothetical protein